MKEQKLDYTELGLKRMADPNLETVAKNLGLTLVVAENGKEPVINAILAAQEKMVEAAGTVPNTEKTGVVTTPPAGAAKPGPIVGEVDLAPVQTKEEIREELRLELLAEVEAEVAIVTTASGIAPGAAMGAEFKAEPEGEPKRAIVIFPEVDEEDERASEVRLSHNGVTNRYKRGYEVSLPMGHYGVLITAVETRHIPQKKVKDGEPSTIERQVPRHPHQFLGFTY